MGESPPQEGAVKGGEELQRPEVAAAVLNVFIKEEAGRGGSLLMASASDAQVGSSAKSSRAGENRQDPRGRIDGARGGGTGEGRAACWHGKKTICWAATHCPSTFCPLFLAAPVPQQSPAASALPGLDTASLRLQEPRTWWPCKAHQEQG